ncbi:MAG: preprotein translocase subunit YajC [Gemmatimonadota bacterium]|nr:preprotein translocase subunit YajC [Gemmatimonadota bacterium]
MTLYAMLAVPREGGNAGMIFLVQMGLIFAIFYFLLLRPQAKQRKRHAQMLKELKKGDEVVTTGGIIGRVVHVEEDRLTVKTGDNTRVTVDRSRVATVIDPQGDPKEKDD